ncbi:hypothetical protein BT63DRAFT_353593, partial [Microthyrium microscopicum]
QGQSDPITYSCSCKAAERGGEVLLFYRYWTNDPQLPLELRDLAYSLGGKIRVASEGYNVTVAGTKDEIESFIEECCSHWSFTGLSLGTKEARDRFFKPSEGCACVFNRVANVRVAAEITPMGIQDYLPQDWNIIESLSPEEFHQRCHEENALLLDVRNHYESRIGYFVDPHNGEAAIRPQIRRFSQWPQYLKNAGVFDPNGKQILTYCTGGIRCEKAVRWMKENTTQSAPVSTLKGGVAAYLAWMDDEISSGRKQPSESLFKGRNYVFDARGSTSLSHGPEPVSTCHICGQSSSQLNKCQSKGCHLVLVVCLDCSDKDIRCCSSCKE